ncbi:outer envelope pore protein 21B, chloroplastic-like [Magnolia sinica]|uniref:outer envelope pore protein 21B, chloroplastic-like n=1 Tax=Magnolia sinica TaxID=86752 RepID=UPI002658E7E5|nr:outer envelope pore protein 21B, chloroplastic-like [Magnolia sinica]
MMQTSLRCAGDAKSLRIHAKEKLPITADSKIQLQVHGELDTGVGAPSWFAMIIRNFYPELSASTGVGLQYDKNEKLKYCVHGKKAFPLSSNGLLSFNIKGRYVADKEFKQGKAAGAAELSWSIINFQRDQDIRLKIGYEVSDNVPYLQIKENNWTLNADMKGKWNVRFDL